MRVVLDVNVWISALLWGGTPRQVVDLAANRQIIIFASEPLFEAEKRALELEELLTRSKTIALATYQKIKKPRATGETPVLRFLILNPHVNHAGIKIIIRSFQFHRIADFNFYITKDRTVVGNATFPF